MSTQPTQKARQKWVIAGLMRTAPDEQQRHRDPVAYWDARTSANDWRASLSIARGAPLHLIDPVLGTASWRPAREPVQMALDLGGVA